MREPQRKELRSATGHGSFNWTPPPVSITSHCPVIPPIHSTAGTVATLFSIMAESLIAITPPENSCPSFEHTRSITLTKFLNTSEGLLSSVSLQAKILDVAYKDKALSMAVLLPNELGGPTKHQEPSGTLPKQDLQNLPVATLIRLSRAPVRNSHIVLLGKIPMTGTCIPCYVHLNTSLQALRVPKNHRPLTEKSEMSVESCLEVIHSDLPLGVPGHCKVTMSSLSEATIKFTLDLFQKLRKSEDNVFYSPVSIAAALAMVYLGAKGGTAEEIEKVLHFSEITARSTEKPKTDHAGNSRSVPHQFQKLLTELNKPTETYELKSANKVYKEKSFQFLQEYVDDIKKFYLADVESVDFVNAAEESRKKINTWVEKQTHEKIKEIFPNGSLQSDTRLVLVNAVYFKGQWDMKFHEEDTIEEKFWLNKDRSKSVKMMKQTNYLKFAHLEDVQAKILEIPYKGKALSMFVLLPDEVDGLQKLEDNLTGEKLMEWTSLQNMAKFKVHLHLPRFKVEESYDLNTVLTDMGMVKAFSQDADFSGMSRNGGLVVSQVKHKSFVEVNEEGTEAAAATGIAVGVTSLPIYEDFHCDHPFLFFIKQNENNSILFFGRVSSP
ncbi:serpin B3-like [Erethizon dorsatum]